MSKSAFIYLAFLCVGFCLVSGCVIDDLDGTDGGFRTEENIDGAATEALDGVDAVEQIEMGVEDTVQESVVDVDVGTGWRDGRSVATLTASNNAVEWETLDVQAPTSRNTPGDAEWIISRIEGQGYTRLLIMTMYTDGGKRNPARILLDGPDRTLSDGRFQLPLTGIAHWRVEYSRGALRIILDGREIWSKSGNYSVDRAVMCDSTPRGFIGYWRPIQ